MGVSTNGQICFGILFDEGYEFPWDKEEFDGDIDNWWLAVNGYKPPFELYDEKGEYIGGVEPPKERKDEYYNHGHEFFKLNPVPVSLVNVCSCDYPQYIVAIEKTEITARRGYPEKLSLRELTTTPEERAVLENFCKAYGLEYSDGPAWWLSSLWC